MLTDARARADFSELTNAQLKSTVQQQYWVEAERRRRMERTEEECLPRHRLERMFKKADLDGDGQVYVFGYTHGQACACARGGVNVT